MGDCHCCGIDGEEFDRLKAEHDKAKTVRQTSAEFGAMTPAKLLKLAVHDPVEMSAAEAKRLKRLWQAEWPDVPGADKVRTFQTRLTAAPQWTTDPPKVPGWYWARRYNNRGPIERPEVVEVHANMQWADDTEGCSRPLEHFDLWAGPIEAPPLPPSAKG
jgi:hypothetical protein